MSDTTPDRVLKLWHPFLHTNTYLRMCRTPDQKRVVGAWWFYEEVHNRFPLNKGWEPPDTPSPPLHEIRQVPSKGRGLFATRDIKQSSVIACERPILLAPRLVVGFRGYEMMNMDKNMLQLLYWLEQEDREKVVQLHNCKSLDESGPLSGIQQTNAIHAHFPGAALCEDYCAICLIISYVNHDCSPNSKWDFDEKTVAMTLSATRDISAGEEITLSYMNAYAPAEHRRKELKQKYDFICTCTCCSSPNSAESDQRRRFIETTLQNNKELPKCVFGRPSAEKTKRNIELLERVLRMMDEEGLHGDRCVLVRNLAAFYGAFGDLNNFRKWCAEAAKLEDRSDTRLRDRWLSYIKNPFSVSIWAMFRKQN